MAIQWPLLIFSVLLSVSSGAMIFAGIGEIKGRFKNVRFILGVVAFAAVAVGGCASAFHLGHPERALHILGNMGSAFSRELFAVGAMAVVSLVYAVLAKKSFEGAAKVFGIIGAVVGVVLPLVAGATYVMAARPVWDTFLLPVMFLSTGVGMGFLLACALVFMKGDEDDKRFALTLALAGVVVMAVAMVLYVAWIAMAPHADESRSIMRLVAGDLALAFWLGVVVVGIVAPIAVAVLVRKKLAANGAADSAAGMLWAAFVCAIAGNVALRVIMYLVATSVEQFIY